MARYEKGRKGATRQQIIEIAARRFRAEGVDAVGVASLMADAGLTSGGFYAHFDSKEDLVKEAIAHAYLETSEGTAAKVGRGTYDLRAFIADYLSAGHRDHPEKGCPLAALSAEMVRRPTISREAFREGSAAIIDRIAAALPASTSEQDRRERAFAVFSHLLGVLQMARLVDDGPMSSAILDRGREDALRLAGFGPVELREH